MVDDLERALVAAEEHEEARLEEGVRLVAARAARHAGQGGPRRDRDRRGVRPARPRGAAHAALRGGRGRDPPGDPEGIPARRPRAPARARRRVPGSPRSEGSLRGPRRPEVGHRRRDQEGLPQARPQAPPRLEPGRRRGRGALQGAAGRLRRPLRPGEAQAVRPARPAQFTGGQAGGPADSPGRGTSATSATWAISSAGSSGAAPARARAAAARAGAASAAPTSASRSRSPSRTPSRASTTRIPVELETACSTCKGTGAEPGTKPVICPECRGRGVTSEDQGFFAFSRPCPRCHGNGTVVEKPCRTCDGSGRERRTKRYTVKIPAGVKDGTRIRLKGKGEAGYDGGPPGDLIVDDARDALAALRAPRRRPRHRGAGHVRRGRARRGGRGADARTGRVSLKVPAGSQDGKLLRVRGHGAPKLNGRRRRPARPVGTVPRS